MRIHFQATPTILRPQFSAQKADHTDELAAPDGEGPMSPDTNLYIKDKISNLIQSFKK